MAETNMRMLRLTSKPSCICEVENYVKKLVDRYKISPDIYPNILISLTEAVNNAVRHGNRSDEAKEVRIGIYKKQDCIRFTITDEGKGFDITNLPDPTAPENIVKCGGRGVFLMRELSDEVYFHNNGSTVELTFRI